MPRVQVYLPEDLYDLMKQHRFSPSELLQQAIRERAKLDEIMAATERYLDDLVAEVGEPGPEAIAWSRGLLAGWIDERPKAHEPREAAG